MDISLVGYKGEKTMKYVSKAASEIAGYTVDVTRTCYTPKELEMIKAALTK